MDSDSAIFIIMEGSFGRSVPLGGGQATLVLELGTADISLTVVLLVIARGGEGASTLGNIVSRVTIHILAHSAHTASVVLVGCGGTDVVLVI